jgi:hypothetical protein
LAPPQCTQRMMVLSKLIPFFEERMKPQTIVTHAKMPFKITTFCRQQTALHLRDKHDRHWWWGFSDQSPLCRERCYVYPLLLCQLPDPHRTQYVCTYPQTARTMRSALWCYTWSLHRNLATGLSRILSTVSHLVWRFMHKFNLPMLVDIKLYSFYTSLYMGRSPHSFAGLPVAHPVPILSPQVWTTDSYFLVATDPLV